MRNTAHTSNSTVGIASTTAMSSPSYCPHWSSNSKTCLLVTDGLLLPVTEHIIAYCGSKFYPSCPHYQQLAPGAQKTTILAEEAANRRRSARIPQYHIMHFSEIPGDESFPHSRTEQTWTIDLSDHGIRFVTYRLLEPETKINFALEGKGKVFHKKGSGRVVWSRALENSQLFHTGIDFS